MVQCPYCAREAELVGGLKIYPHRPDLSEKQFYLCEPCNAYVGCHPNTTRPLGRLADAKLRRAKMAAHAAFDPIWKSGKLHRASAYKWLATQLCIPRKECHIGMFDVGLCTLVVKVCHETYGVLPKELK